MKTSDISITIVEGYDVDEMLLLLLHGNSNEQATVLIANTAAEAENIRRSAVSMAEQMPDNVIFDWQVVSISEMTPYRFHEVQRTLHFIIAPPEEYNPHQLLAMLMALCTTGPEKYPQYEEEEEEEEEEVAQVRETYTVDEVSMMLGLSRGLTYRALRNGEIPNIRLGRRVIIPKKHFNEWLDCDVVTQSVHE